MSDHPRHQSQNVYDTDESFWDKYSQFPRMINGLDGASEWPLLRRMLPDSLAGKHVLDLGCGDCIIGLWATTQGAASVHGCDISLNMLDRAARNQRDLTASLATTTANRAPVVQATFSRVDLEDIRLGDLGLPPLDLVVSGLALHYIADFDTLARRVHDAMAPGGRFVFSVEHPMLTAPRRPGFLSHNSSSTSLSSMRGSTSNNARGTFGSGGSSPAVTLARPPPRRPLLSHNSSCSSLSSVLTSADGVFSAPASCVSYPSTIASSAAASTDSLLLLKSSSSGTNTGTKTGTTNLHHHHQQEEVEEDHNSKDDAEDYGQHCYYWPVESYFAEGDRHVPWLGASVLKQHRTVSTYFNVLRAAGFDVYDMAEWGAASDTARKHPDWPEGVCPRFLVLGAQKRAAAAAPSSKD